MTNPTLTPIIDSTGAAPNKNTITKDGVTVSPGQRWRDLDKRSCGRTVVVESVDAERGVAKVRGAVTGRLTSLSIRRMHKHHNGFVLEP